MSNKAKNQELTTRQSVTPAKIKRLTKKALKDGAYKRWKKLLNQKLQANKPTSCQAQSLQDLDPTIDWNKFLKELTS